MTKPKTDKSSSEILAEQEIQRLEENEAEITRLKKQMKPKTDKQGWVDELYRLDVGDPDSKGCTISLGEYLRTDAIADCEVNDKKADEFWGWFKLKMEEEYKRGREDEAIECQKDMERVVEETKREVMKGIKVNQKEFVKQANEVRRILEEEKRTMTGAYDVTTRAGKKRFRDMLRELVE